MQAIDLDKKLVDSYLKPLKNMSPGSKLDLIEKLAASLKSGKKSKTPSLKFLPGEFIHEKSADEIINDLKNKNL